MVVSVAEATALEPAARALSPFSTGVPSIEPESLTRRSSVSGLADLRVVPMRSASFLAMTKIDSGKERESGGWGSGVAMPGCAIAGQQRQDGVQHGFTLNQRSRCELAGP